jgi:2-desacetyl-2-hydroxyethyl bacteriochlorophyllide A dehydrogenase
MWAVRVDADRSVRLQEVPVPAPGPGQVLVRVAACGICGTDRHIARGEYPSARPVTLGHEVCGVVVEHGSQIARDVAAAGSLVAIDPNIACGACVPCRRGDSCLCEHRLAIGVDVDGGLAEFVVAPQSQIYPLPPAVAPAWGALCEPLACCLHALDLAAIKPGASVVVVGGGVTGQFMVQLARLAGAGHVLLATRQAGRRSLAERLGATASIDPAQHDVVWQVAGPEGLLPGGADVAIECVGSTTTFEQCLALVRRGGTVVLFGVAPRADLARISPFEIFARELRVLGSYLNPHTHGRAVDLVASGRLALDPLISRRVDLAAAVDAIVADPLPGEVKVLLTLSA